MALGKEFGYTLYTKNGLALMGPTYIVKGSKTGSFMVDLLLQTMKAPPS